MGGDDDESLPWHLHNKKDVRIGVGGTDGHLMQFAEARRTITDKFGDNEPVDDNRYSVRLTESAAAAAVELEKLHPLLASKRPPNRALFRRYAKLLTEAADAEPMDKERLRSLRRELGRAPASAAGLQAIRARFS